MLRLWTGLLQELRWFPWGFRTSGATSHYPFERDYMTMISSKNRLAKKSARRSFPQNIPSAVEIGVYNLSLLARSIQPARLARSGEFCFLWTRNTIYRNRVHIQERSLGGIALLLLNNPNTYSLDQISDILLEFLMRHTHKVLVILLANVDILLL